MARASQNGIQNDASVDEFLGSISDELKREDAKRLARIMERVTGEKPKMWGGGMIGFGSYHYKYSSGREGDWMKIGFSPRKSTLTLYLMDSYDFKEHQKLLGKLGSHKTGKSCLYIKQLADIDMNVLEQLIKASYDRVSAGRFLQA